MNYKNYLDGIYRDFFNEPLIDTKETITKEETVKEDVDLLLFVDDLYIDDYSKNTLKKIIKYMEDYHLEKEKLYINFNIIIESDNDDITNQISNLLKQAIVKYKYTNSFDCSSISFYKIENNEIITKLYEKNGIVVLKDLNAFNMNDTNDKNKLLYTLKEQLTKKNITIISDKKDNIKNFMLYDDLLENKYFSFRIVSVRPDSNDIYNMLLKKLTEETISDKIKVDVLDYINSTYDKSNNDYVSYLDNLCKFISFNKSVPLIETIKSSEEIFKDLNELVGLNKVKKNLNELVDLITLKNKTINDLKINDINLHMVFLGNPGTGKTTVARMICGILYDLKYISQNKLIEVSPKDLVAEYVGQTGPKTMDVINRAMGGVLFVDEAYTLADRGDNTYNAEAIATLIKSMEDYRNNLVVILAGYTKEMQPFLSSNSGIVSRIGYTLEFDDYTEEELRLIFSGMVKKSGFILEEDALSKFDELVKENKNKQNFGNARFARNVFEKSILKHATNTKNIKQTKRLKTITKYDINYD